MTDKIVEAVIQQMRSRSEVGMKKIKKQIK
jgi:hypothetical protein